MIYIYLWRKLSLIEKKQIFCFMEQLNWNILVICENKSTEIPEVVVSESGKILIFKKCYVVVEGENPV